MNKWRHSKRGLTSIKIILLVIMIGVLAIVGLKFYTIRQQEKAKNAVIETMQNIENYNAVVRINCETIQTLIQVELADADYKTVKSHLTTNDGDIFFYESGIQVPGGGQQTRNGSNQKGWVVVSFDDTLERFLINGNAFDGSNVLTDPLVARL